MTHGNEFNGEIKLLNKARQVNTWRKKTGLSRKFYIVESETVIEQIQKVPLLHQVDDPSEQRDQKCKEKKELVLLPKRKHTKHLNTSESRKAKRRLNH